MSGKINVAHIVRDHIATLKDARTDERSWSDLLVFYVAPASAAAVMIYFDFRLHDGQTTVLITALSIFAALLFNLLLLTHRIVTGSSGTEPKGTRRDLLREVYASISYAILVSVIAIVLLLLNVIFQPTWVSAITSFFVYFLVANFLLTLLLVLKRIHVMLGEEFK